jgi:hypothetical protein
LHTLTEVEAVKLMEVVAKVPGTPSVTWGVDLETGMDELTVETSWPELTLECVKDVVSLSDHAAVVCSK